MIIPVGYAQVNFRFDGFAIPTGAEVALGCVLGGEDDPVVIATGYKNAWLASFTEAQTDETNFKEVLVKFGPNIDGISTVLPVGVVGGRDVLSESPNVAILVQKRTGTGGRKGLGRMFVPGLDQDDVTGAGQLTSTALALWQAKADEFLGHAAIAAFPPVLLHAEAGPPAPITDLVVSQTVATQRRRLRR